VSPEILVLDELFGKVDEYNKQVHGIEKKDYSELVERLGNDGPPTGVTGAHPSDR
jgi:hypothetical protein